MRFVHLLIAVAKQPPASPARAQSGMILLLGLASLLLILLLCMMLIILARRLRRAQERAARASNASAPDPWKAAGRRVNLPPES